MLTKVAFDDNKHQKIILNLYKKFLCPNVMPGTFLTITHNINDFDKTADINSTVLQFISME